MTLDGPSYCGTVVFESGLVADIVSISLGDKCFILTALVLGPGSGIRDPSSYVVYDICGNKVVSVRSKHVKPVGVPGLEAGESVIVTLNVEL